MLAVITICLIVLASRLLYVKKTKESYLILGACICLAIEICGVMIFIAKKGGISNDVMLFLYFSRKFLTQIQYLGITLNQLGYLIAIGRTLFPMFFLMLSLRYSMIGYIRKSKWIEPGIMALPLASLVIYYPAIYRTITETSKNMQNLIMLVNIIWITVYLVVGVGLLVFEYFSIHSKIIKRQFGNSSMCIIAMALLYSLYYRQEPGQVYRFYSEDFVWNKGIGYLQFNPHLVSYVSLVVVTLVCMVTGFYSLFQYTSGMYEEKKEEIIMRRSSNMAKESASMFVHGMKNQLLASKVVYKRIWAVCEQPDVDIDKLKEYISSLETMNNGMLERIEELYRSIKSNAICLKPIDISEIVDGAINLFAKKYPTEKIDISIDGAITILADKFQFCEALYNLLVNAQDAVIIAEKECGIVKLKCYNERSFTVIEVMDNGNGMNKAQMKKVFEPFYSSKNSNYNWGMGLYYTRKVVKGHSGTMKIESKLGQGSSFFIMLPRYY